MCIQTANFRACECECGYIGSGLDSCVYIPPSKLMTFIVGFKVPIEIPSNLTKYDAFYQTTRMVMENFMDPLLRNLNGYISRSIKMIGVRYLLLI